MKILFEMFKFICSVNEIHPRFLDFVFGMGRRNSSSDEIFNGCYNNVSFAQRDNARLTSYGKTKLPRYSSPYWSLKDTCYNLRYMERHGRELHDPWSCRQTAICQKYHYSHSRSTWLIIHHPQALYDSLRDMELQNIAHPMALHIRCLRAALHNWREYLNFRGTELRSLVSAPAFTGETKGLIISISNNRMQKRLFQSPSRSLTPTFPWVRAYSLLGRNYNTLYQPLKAP